VHVFASSFPLPAFRSAPMKSKLPAFGLSVSLAGSWQLEAI
jgi:hypothetical protein